LLGWRCQSVGFPKHERMPDAERETSTREWLEQIEASARQKRGEDMAAAGRDLMPATEARGTSENDHEKHGVLARNRRQMRTKGPAIELMAMMSREQVIVCCLVTHAMIPIKPVVVDSEVV
jgi:hypothetical protein